MTGDYNMSEFLDIDIYIINFFGNNHIYLIFKYFVLLYVYLLYVYLS